MDINTFRGLLTLVLMLSFIGIWAWAWSKHRKQEFDKSAALPLEEDRYMTNNDREKN